MEAAKAKFLVKLRLSLGMQAVVKFDKLGGQVGSKVSTRQGESLVVKCSSMGREASLQHTSNIRVELRSQ